MGSGKTLGGIERDLRLRETRKSTVPWKTLIVAPLGTHDQWCRAIRKETGVEPYRIDPKDRNAVIKAGNVYVVIHYEAMRLLPKLRGKFYHVIFDECHKVKNRKARVTYAARQLKPECMTMMSGSPASDKPHDFWSILNILWPKHYTSFHRFYDSFIDYEEKIRYAKGPDGKMRPAGTYKVPIGVKPAWGKELSGRLAPVYSRVTKKEAMPDLPELVENTVYVDLYPEQRALYDEFNEEMITWVREQREDQDTGELEPLIATQVIAKLQRLQQFALGTLTWHADRERYTMSMPSSKLDWTIETIGDNEDEPFVVFSQFKGPLILLQRALKDVAPVVMYTGDQSNKVRDAARVSFSQGRSRVFLATYSAGGTGLDGLQNNCRQAILLDWSWQPLENEQATSRLHRGGQTRSVQATSIVANNTVDLERRLKVTKKKRAILQMLGDI